jgi:putative membrane protein
LAAGRAARSVGGTTKTLETKDERMTLLTALPLLDVHDHAWWPIWPLLWAALIGTAIWLILRRRDHRHDPLDRAREVLAERYARGELTGEEYRQRLGEL